MKLEIVRGREQYLPEYLLSKLQPVEPVGAARAAREFAEAAANHSEDAIPEPARAYSELYSNKHEKLVLRADHIARMDAIRQNFNKQRLHAGRRSLTTSDIVNACLDFVFEHPVPFHRVTHADAVRELIAEHVYRDVISRWRQYYERF